MKAIIISLRYLVLMTFLLGGIYPLIVLLVGGTLFPRMSHGSLEHKNNEVVGSYFIGQKFTREEYFWSRPSVVDYNSALGSASNKSATSKELMESVESRRKIFGHNAPMDLLTASASGLDPHISLESAEFQKERIRHKRNLTPEAIDAMIHKATDKRFLGFMGQPRVNVLELNLLLDK